jgi:actin related protein 2/3 complex subunit 3
MHATLNHPPLLTHSHSLTHSLTDEEDIIDETLNFFRANVFFRNFDVKGRADRTLIYLTLYTHYLLGKAEKIEDRATGMYA